MRAEITRSMRNIIATLIHVDPAEAFPGADQSARRARFEENPHTEFLRCTDCEQAHIAELLMKSLGPELIELCVLAEEDTRRQMGG